MTRPRATGTLTVIITKGRSGWSVCMEILWAGTTTPTRTYRPANTLAWALFYSMDNSDGLTLASITVKERPMPRAEALGILEAHFGHASYTLTQHRRLLLTS